VDPHAAANETPIAQGLDASIAQFGEPLKRHANPPAIFEMDDEIAFVDLHAEGSGLLRC
jgi:hypothetical protein